MYMERHGVFSRHFFSVPIYFYVISYISSLVYMRALCSQILKVSNMIFCWKEKHRKVCVSFLGIICWIFRDNRHQVS